MCKKIIFVGLLLAISTFNKAVTFEDIGTVFSTVAAVTDNVTNTTDSWRAWCGKLTDTSCIVSTVLAGGSILFGVGGCCCLVTCGIGIGCLVIGVPLLKPILIPTSEVAVQIPFISLDAGLSSLDDYKKQCQLRKEKQKEILLQLKQQHDLEFEMRRVELPKKCAIIFMGKLKEQQLKKQKTDMVFFC